MASDEKDKSNKVHEDEDVHDHDTSMIGPNGKRRGPRTTIKGTIHKLRRQIVQYF